MLGMGKIVCPEDNGLTALAEFRIERLVLDDRPQAEIECNEAEAVHTRAEIRDPTLRMLEMPVSGLAAVARTHSRDKHTVIVDQPDTIVIYLPIAPLHRLLGYRRFRFISSP